MPFKKSTIWITRCEARSVPKAKRLTMIMQ